MRKLTFIEWLATEKGINADVEIFGAVLFEDLLAEYKASAYALV